MELSLKNIEKRENEKKNKNNNEKKLNDIYQRAVYCPKCGGQMKYVYGEIYECMTCGEKDLTDFGKVREYLEKNGPQPAVVISKNTGVALDVISSLLHQGRIEIPDGSPVYIKCQNCGTDIRYGRYCPECSSKLARKIGKAYSLPTAGEKPKNGNRSGKMHTFNDRNKTR
ncbi:MAG: hypothetical protein ACI4E1_13315 [Lachnospira sp.]